MNKKILLPLLFILGAIVSRFWLTPLNNRLPAAYTSELTYQAEDSFRDSPTGNWSPSTLTVQSSQQTITASNGVLIIQSNLLWYSSPEEVIFESTGLYGVDRNTGLNNAAYGDQPRNGQFLFPAHVEKKDYIIWDPQYIGPRTAVYDRSETRNGLPVYAFRFRAEGLDETEGYNALPGVPERYHAYTNAKGSIWVEPVSGIVVDYEEEGLSYFVDPANKQPLADFHHWNARYTVETQADQLAQARVARLRILVLGIWLPGVLMTASLLGLVINAGRPPN